MLPVYCSTVTIIIYIATSSSQWLMAFTKKNPSKHFCPSNQFMQSKVQGKLKKSQHIYHLINPYIHLNANIELSKNKSASGDVGWVHWAGTQT